MKKKLLYSLLICLFTVNVQAQLTDDFTDGDFSDNPSWIGNDVSFTVNAALQLQSNNTVANSNFYLSTASTKATEAQWEFYCRFAFNPSSTNYTDIYLIASASDLTNTSTTGYFVRIGNTDDEISLYRKDAGQAAVKIIDGANGTTNSSNNVMKIKVIRNAANQWTLSKDLTGNGTNYAIEGSVTDATYLSAAFFGIWIRQTTSSFFQRHYFDDISVTNYVPDAVPPAIQSATATSATTLDVLFNEPVEIVTSQTTVNYMVSNGLGVPTTAVRDASNNALLHLGFLNSFPNNISLLLTASGINDLASNTMNNGSASFVFFKAKQNDIIINEIMADPGPVVGLPDAEWIELKNNSGVDINLQGWRIGKPSGQSGPMPSYILKADSFVLVCSSSAVAALSAFAPSIEVTGFPAISNTGDLLFLRSPQGLTIHAVDFKDTWYKNELKQQGGWSLEMIYSKNACGGFVNWAASENSIGGTPGKKNSTESVNADVSFPRLLRAYATDSMNIVLVFNEALDSVNAAIADNYIINDGIGTAVQAVPLNYLFNSVALRLPNPLLRNKIYTVTASVMDCYGNAIGASNTAQVGLTEKLQRYDVVINEILFNPSPKSNDYVELYNRSNKIISLRNAYIANRNTSGTISSITQVSADDYLLFPQSYIVLTQNASLVTNSYIANNIDAFVELNMPSYNDDKGNVILLNETGDVMEEIAYNENWHYKLISLKEGVAMERINYNDTTMDNPQTINNNEQSANWMSAASTVGYGTPTYKNSQFLADAGVQGTITTTPEAISPDNNGMGDFLTIHYSFPEPGYTANIVIYDGAGNPVRKLQQNALCGTTGKFTWDGLGENNKQLRSALYIINTEVFNLQGMTKRYRNVVAIAATF